MRDRVNAMLTEADREYLQGKEYDGRRARYDRRTSIRQGVTLTLEDIQLFAEEGDRDGFETIEFEESNVTSDDLVPLVVFLYRAAWELDVEPEALLRNGQTRARAKVLDQVIGKLARGVNLDHHDYQLVIDQLAADPEAFDAVFPDEDPPRTRVEKSQFVQRLDERSLDDLWRPVLEAAHLPYDEEDLARRKQQTRQALEE